MLCINDVYVLNCMYNIYVGIDYWNKWIKYVWYNKINRYENKNLDF